MTIAEGEEEREYSPASVKKRSGLLYGLLEEVDPMSKKLSRPVTLREYITEVLKNAIYEKGERLDVVIAEAPDLPGCFTQGATLEQARENLIDAIEVWIMAALQSGKELPIVNGFQLAITTLERGRQRAKANSAAKTRIGA